MRRGRPRRPSVWFPWQVKKTSSSVFRIVPSSSADLPHLWGDEGLLVAESAQVVLAGDPKQLGPIVRSPFALKYGVGKDGHTRHECVTE